MSFVIDNIQNGDLPFSLHIENGVIAAIGTDSAMPADTERYDAAGAMYTPGFVDAHVHLDKALILDRCVICEGNLPEAVRLTAAAKSAFTEDDVYARAEKVLEMAVRAGTQSMRSFVEVDPRAGLRSFHALKRLQSDWADMIDLQLCVFAQDGLTQEMETYTLMREAMALGGDVVGGCPYTDPDPVAHVSLIFDLAAEFNADVDFHIDFNLDPAGTILPEIIAQTTARDWRGRVTVGHATKFAAFTPTRRAELAQAMVEAGIALVVLPSTDSFLNGDRTDPLRPRGIAPAADIASEGVMVALASNNVQNPFTPFGDASLIRMGGYYANLDQLSSDAQMEHVFQMICENPAHIVRGGPVSLAVGAPADFILIAAQSRSDTIRANRPVMGIVKGGRIRLWAPQPPLTRGF
ncbi:amidohydrolase family protein [Ketogulonicigenium vulgare]|uniref:Aminohydrolase protein n=1 Tax=Ketogulonicigenium vulgare (strain WSH-001) TaxID=759362 RepID=F9Y6W2_KETVW|nr:amidohydrolase family protein [Ketogulonicigenium vulgare]ADO42793.1 aminohydrolase protein [Ketogulonicigenium vulgare Y25]AEM40979.1 Aminohydrolase protein [Ketogulonicigenium vulgare WSH-001]ALJ81130.1 amidohydrolase [Ketogulonicigenium vulgare]ANW33879.1 amidohydrolase [Ketogulonicigenium vulgare]AOZ54705.1 aminohydrolase protein [Ketogulonicigenium vulgare]